MKGCVIALFLLLILGVFMFTCMGATMGSEYVDTEILLPVLTAIGLRK